MNKIIFTLIFFWVLWKVLKSVLEEIQKRMEDQGLDRRKSFPAESPEGETQQLRTRPPVPRPAPPAREPQEWRSGDPVPGEEESELERWFRQAVEHKKRMKDAAAPPPSGRRTPSEPVRPQPAQPRETRPRAAQPRAAQPRAPVRRVEPRVEYRRETRAERQRVVHPVEPVVTRPPVEHREVSPAMPRPRKGRRERVQAPRRTRAGAGLAGIGELDLHDVRRGIILAEILGPAKGLGDIDSHVI